MYLYHLQISHQREVHFGKPIGSDTELQNSREFQHNFHKDIKSILFWCNLEIWPAFNGKPETASSWFVLISKSVTFNCRLTYSDRELIWEMFSSEIWRARYGIRKSNLYSVNFVLLSHCKLIGNKTLSENSSKNSHELLCNLKTQNKI